MVIINYYLPKARKYSYEQKRIILTIEGGYECYELLCPKMIQDLMLLWVYIKMNNRVIIIIYLYCIDSECMNNTIQLINEQCIDFRFRSNTNHTLIYLGITNIQGRIYNANNWFKPHLRCNYHSSIWFIA